MLFSRTSSILYVNQSEIFVSVVGISGSYSSGMNPVCKDWFNPDRLVDLIDAFLTGAEVPFSLDQMVEHLRQSYPSLNASAGAAQLLLFAAIYRQKPKEVTRLSRWPCVSVNDTDEKGRTVLEIAALRSTPEVVAALLTEGAKVETVDAEGKTVIHKMVHSSQRDGVAILRCLLNIHSVHDVLALSSGGERAIHRFVRYGRPDLLQCLLEHRDDMTQRASSGLNAVHLAAFFGQDACLEILLSHASKNGSKNTLDISNLLEAETKGKLKALHLAANSGRAGACEILLRYGAEIDARTSDGRGYSPLHGACHKNRPEVVEALLHHIKENSHPDTFPEYLEMEDSEENTALNIALNEESWDVLPVLKKYGASVSSDLLQNITFCKSDFLTDFEHVVQWVIHDFITQEQKQTLLEAICELYDFRTKPSLDGFGELLYWIGVEASKSTGVGLLIKYKIVDVNLRNRNHNTALMESVKKASIDLTEVLLGFEADVKLTNPAGMSAIHYAADESSVAILDLLLAPRYSANIEAPNALGMRPVHLAAITGYLPIVQRLFHAGVDLTAVTSNDEKRTVLHLASIYGHLTLIEWLCGVNKPIAATEPQRFSVNPSSFVFNRSSIVVPTPIRKGVTPLSKPALTSWDLEQIDGTGYRALHLASFNGHENVSQRLLELGADEDARGACGLTALQDASTRGHNTVVRKILLHRQKKGNKALDDYVGFWHPKYGMALDIACSRGFISTVQTLLEFHSPINNQSLATSALLGELEIVEILVEMISRSSLVYTSFTEAIFQEMHNVMKWILANRKELAGGWNGSQAQDDVSYYGFSLYQRHEGDLLAIHSKMVAIEKKIAGENFDPNVFDQFLKSISE
jgi:ankyrin repeat protein